MSKLHTLIQLNAKADKLLEFGISDILGSASKKIGPWGMTIAKQAGQSALGYGTVGAGIGGISGALSSDPDRSFLKGAVSGGAKGAVLGAALGGGGTALSPLLSRGAAKFGTPLVKKYGGAGAPEGFKMGGDLINEEIRKGGYKGNLGQFSSRHTRLVQLNAKLDSLIEFGKFPKKIKGKEDKADDKKKDGKKPAFFK